MEQTLIQDSIDQFLSSLALRGRSQNTIDAYTSDLTLFKEWINKNEVVDDLDTSAMKYLNSLKATYKPASLQRKASAVRSYAKWAGKQALQDFKMDKPAKRSPKIIEEYEVVEKMVIYAGEVGLWGPGAAISLMGRLGLRISEVLALTPADFDMQNMSLHVRGKGGQHRQVPLTKTVLWEVGDMHDVESDSSEPLFTYSRQWMSKLVKQVAHHFGYEMSPHSFRATVASHLLDNGVSIRVVQEILGHADVRTTEIYTRVNEKAMSNALGGLA